jgi:predicted 3-demethylubiquinone-9 3-methyltransferase (glyoxalase superfamily)
MKGDLPMEKIVPFLWFDGRAEEAVTFYTSIFNDATAGRVRRFGPGGPFPAGSVMSVEFRLFGRGYVAFNGGPMFSFSPAVSMFVNCETQQEVDELWTKLSAGGEQQRCGWLKDKFGLSWQIVPTGMGKLMTEGSPEQSKRVVEAMLKMTKIDIAILQNAFDNA